MSLIDNVMVTADKFNTKSLSHSEFKKFDEKKSMRKISWVNYKYPKIEKPLGLSIRIEGDFSLTLEGGGGGIPPHHETYAPTNDKRQFIKIPLVPGHENCQQIRDVIEKYLEYVENNKEKIFGKEAKDYEVISPIAEGSTDVESDDDNEKDNKKNRIKVPSFDTIKFRFTPNKKAKDFDFQDPVIKSNIIVIDPDTGKFHRLKDPKIDDITEYFGLGCKYRIVFSIERLSGALVKKDKKAKYKECNVILSLKQLIITQRKSSSGKARDEFSKPAYADIQMDSESDTGSHDNRRKEADSKLSKEPVNEDGSVVKQDKNVPGPDSSNSDSDSATKAKAKAKAKAHAKAKELAKKQQSNSDSEVSDSDASSIVDKRVKGKGKLVDSDSDISDSDSDTLKKSKEKSKSKKH